MEIYCYWGDFGYGGWICVVVFIDVGINIMVGKIVKWVLVIVFVLFNEYGENSVMFVDIVMEMDISLGNLYYYFKGKEFIVDVFIEWYNIEM